MRHLKIAVGVIVAVCAFGVSATSALAADFEAVPSQKVKEYEEQAKTASEPLKKELEEKAAHGMVLKSFGAARQEFKIGPVKYKYEEEAFHAEAKWVIICENAKVTGTAPAHPSPTLTVKVKYQKCTFTGTGQATPRSLGVNPKSLTSALPEFTYNVNGTVKSDKPIIFKLGGAVKCNVNVPVQTIASLPEVGEYEAATYGNVELPTMKKPEKTQFGSTRGGLLIENNIVVHDLEKSETETNEKTKEKETTVPEKAGLSYELEPWIGKVNGEEAASPHSLCTPIPESETVPVEHIKGKPEMEEVDPREGKNGVYAEGKNRYSTLQVELPGGALKITH